MPFMHNTSVLTSLYPKPNEINPIFTPNPVILSSMSMGGNNGGARHQSSQNITVAQALEIARDSAEGAQDPTVLYILEAAITDIWGKIQAYPSSYVMTRDEFAIFNYFQGRFEGERLATAAKKRYWDHLDLTNGA